MSVKKFLKMLIVATFFSQASFAANATTVNFVVYAFGFPYQSGSFVGMDGNADGLLSLNELTYFVDYTENIRLSDLSDFGSFNPVSNVWNADAFGWGINNIAWYSWHGGDYSANKLWATVKTEIAPSDVSEPASFALLGLGLFGFFAARMRKQ